MSRQLVVYPEIEMIPVQEEPTNLITKIINKKIRRFGKNEKYTRIFIEKL